MNDRIVVRKDSNSDWVLCRTKGVKHYFYITNPSCLCLGPMLHLGDISKNFLKCRSVACAMFDAFVFQIKKDRG